VNNVQKVQDSLPVGAVIQGRYIVESLLGKGSFGSIYLVWDQHNKQKLLVLAEVINPNEQESYRFTLDYVSPTPFRHQALPQVQYVFNDDKLSRAYLLMSYIEEPNLEILRLQQSEKRFPLPQVMAMIAPVINAVAYLHHQSPPVIHQNIQPAIIIPTNADRSVLVMLGIVKEYDSTTTNLHYLAPGYGATEQYREEEYSARTDIYGLGATCYTLLTGIIPPDALYRSTQLSNGEIDPLKPLNEAIPTTPTFMAEAIQRAMSINAHDRFSSVQQFKQALKADPGLQASSMLKSHLILPEQDLSLKADSVEQKPLGTMIAATGTTQNQINLVEQKSPEAVIVPSVPTGKQTTVPEVTPLPLVAEKPSVPEVAPPVLVAEEPPVLEVTPLPLVAEEPPVLEAAPSSQANEEPPRAWKPGVLLIVLALLFGLGISVLLWSDIPGHPAAHSGTPTPSVKSSTLTPPTVSSIYPSLTGTYSGTIYDVSMDVSTSISLTGIRQSQGNISGYLTLGPKLQGSGPFSGTINTTKELKFTVTDTAGSVTLFFEGVMQSATGLTGDYYRCSSVSLSQEGRCRQAPDIYGIWSLGLTSSG
jgi:eukaryotic-like serine/threonine-protein kinase